MGYRAAPAALLVVLAGALLAACEPPGVQCGDVITEDTVLAHDLIGCATDGLVIGANGVRLDLNGHLIEGTFAPDTAGVRNEGFANVSVVDGRTTRFEVGVLLDGVRDNVVRAIEAVGHLEDGLRLTGSTATEVLENRFEGSETGARLRASDGNRVVRNTLVGNELQNLVLQDGSDDNVVEGNQALDTNLIDGINIQGSDGNSVRYNQVLDNSGFGVVVTSGSDANLVARNTVSGNRAGGILVQQDAVRNTVRRNTTRRNGGDGPSRANDGILVEQPGTVVAENEAYDNVDFGIQAVPGVMDGGGNRASGNGQPAQCLNVACAK